MYKNDPQKDMERDIKHMIRLNGFVSAAFLAWKYKITEKKAKEIAKKHNYLQA